MSTPGPWYPVIPPQAGRPLEIWGETLVCTMPALSQSYADGNMIAAAPRLVEVLEEITNHFADVMRNHPAAEFKNVENIPTIKAARAAIRSARTL